MKRKSKVRWGTLVALASSLGGIALTVASDPHVMQSVAARTGVSITIVGAVVGALKKALTRDEHERFPGSDP